MSILDELIMEPAQSADRDELASLAFWHWEMRGHPEDRLQEDWFWAEAELQRLRQAQMAAEGQEPEA